MNLKFTLTIAYCCLVNILFCQNTIEGFVKDENGKEVFFATVLLFNNADGQFVKSTTTEESGRFVIENLSDGSYSIEVTMLGFKPSSKIEVTLPADREKTIEIGLVTDAKLLKEIVVTAEIPLLEQKADRLVVNVENSIIGANGNFLDVVKMIPGVFLTNNGIRMAGQNSLTILINGKSTQYMNVEELLRDMPASNIKQIEVIHQPGAEFDASGSGPLINVVLKRKNLLGTNGWIAGRVQKDYKWLYGTGFFLSHYYDDVNVNAYLGYTRNANQEILNISRKVKDDLYTQKSIDPKDSDNFTSNITIDWDVAEKHRLGITGQYNTGLTDQIQSSTTSIDFAEIDDVNLSTVNTQDGDWQYLAVNPYYSLSFDTTAHHLDFDFNYFQLNTTSTNTLITDNVGNLNASFPSQLFMQPGKTQILGIKADYSKPIGMAFKIDAGGKYSKADLENDLSVFGEDSENNWQKDLSRSNLYKFDEEIKAVYTKLSVVSGKWAGTVGLRFEDSKSVGESVTLVDTLEYKISKLFPSMSIRREIAGPLATSLAYSYRIDRPGYFDLNPFTTNLDPFTAIRGNPVLIPSLTHSMEFKLIYDNFPFFSIDYKLRNDPLVEVTEQNDETGETFLNTVNLDQQRVFNAQFSFPLDFFIKPIKGFAGIIVNHNKYDSQFLAEDFIRDRWTYTFFLRTQFQLPGKIDTELGFNYVSGVLDGIISLDHFYNFQVGMGRRFFKEKVRLGIDVSDVFYRFRNGQIKFANMDIAFEDSWYVPRFTFSLSYLFGNRHLKKEKTRKLGAQEEINRSQK